MPDKVKNSAIAQPGEGLKVEVYKIDPTVIDGSKGDEWGRGLEDQIGRNGSGLTTCEGSDTETANVEWNGGVIHGCQAEYVLVHYSGTITAPGEAGQSRSIVMTMAADDGNSLSIDGNSVIEDWRAKGCYNTTGEVTMEAGKPVAIDAWYFQFRGGSCAGLYWQIDGSEIAVIPPSAFTPGDVKAPETSVAPEEETTTSVEETTTTIAEAPTEVVVDEKAQDFACSEACVAGYAAAAGLPNGEVSVSLTAELRLHSQVQIRSHYLLTHHPSCLRSLPMERLRTSQFLLSVLQLKRVTPQLLLLRNQIPQLLQKQTLEHQTTAVDLHRFSGSSLR